MLIDLHLQGRLTDCCQRNDSLEDVEEAPQDGTRRSAQIGGRYKRRWASQCVSWPAQGATAVAWLLLSVKACH
jgi:hypothetical protein